MKLQRTKNCLEFARVQVAVSSFKEINQILQCNIDDMEFRIRVTEEFECLEEKNSRDDNVASDEEDNVSEWTADGERCPSLEPAAAVLYEGKSTDGGENSNSVMVQLHRDDDPNSPIDDSVTHEKEGPQIGEIDGGTPLLNVSQEKSTRKESIAVTDREYVGTTNADFDPPGAHTINSNAENNLYLGGSDVESEIPNGPTLFNSGPVVINKPTSLGIQDSQFSKAHGEEEPTTSIFDSNAESPN